MKALLIKKEQSAVFVLLGVILILAQIFSPGYLALPHLSGLLRLSSFLGLAAIGQTMVILTGGIDLSIANTITLANVLAAQIMMGSNQNIPLALAAVLAAGVVVGVVNGCGIKYLKIPPFIMTLGTNCVVQGIFMIITNGAPKGNSAPALSFLCNGTIGGTVSGIVVLWLLISIICLLLLKKTPYGRKIYSVGSSLTASAFSGVNTGGVIFTVYILSAMIAAMTGFFLVGYTGTSYLDVGAGYTDSTIAAVIIGGTAITGGKGGYLGTVAGAVIMTVLNDILVIVNIPQAGRSIIQGGIIILLVLIYAREKMKK